VRLRRTGSSAARERSVMCYISANEPEKACRGAGRNSQGLYPRYARTADRNIRLFDGRIVEESQGAAMAAIVN
jgi:hypothetical protein